MNDELNPQGPHRGGRVARVFALGALTALTACLAYVGHQVYLAATDAFVAPVILAPDNDQVLATKLRATELAVERARTASAVEAADEAIGAAGKGIERLKSIQRTPAAALAWTNKINAHQVSAGFGESRMLVAQRALLAEMAQKQETVVAAGRANLASGLVSQVDLAKEMQTRDQLRLALLENDRTRLQTGMQMQQLMLARQSLAGKAPPMPEVMIYEEQAVRIELEVIKLQSEQRTRRSERKLLVDKLATLDEIGVQLKSRPLYRATEKAIDVAFVPYTQIKDVRTGAVVYDCVWGAFHCRAVGQVAEVVPGEVILPDPWGNQARGQFAVLTLSDHDSAKAKTLRIRATSGPMIAPKPEREERVSAK